jgi:hypothetical protein
MEQIFTADLSLQEHADATVWLLNEYAKDDMGGGTGLTEFTQQNLIAELRKRPTIHVILAFVDNHPAGLVLGPVPTIER